MTSGFLKKVDFLENKSAPGSEVAQDKWFLQKQSNLWKKFCPRQRSCPGQVASYRKFGFLEKHLPQAAKLPGTSGLFKKKVDFLEKSSAPGSEAARDKWCLQNKSIFWKKFCPRQRSCPGQVVSSKTVYFLEKVLPQAAKLPGASGSLKDKWLVQKKSDF